MISMKKYLSIILLLLIAGLRSNAQSEVQFTLKMMPNRTYSSNIKMNMDMEMNYGGDSAVVKKMKASGAGMPMLLQTETATTAEIKTGALTAANDFPFTMDLKQMAAKSTMNGKDLPSGVTGTNQTMSGVYTADGKMDIQSISGTTMTAAMKESMTKMVKNIMGAIEFPDKAMKPGDTFTQDMPFDMPLPGMTPKMLMKATYKLIDIQAGKANFDLAFVMTVNALPTMSMNGTGGGKMVYDIASSYPTSTVQNMNITYDMAIPQQQMHLNGKMKMMIDQQSVVK